MKRTGKAGKRPGQVGYRTSSRFLHKKTAENDRLRLRVKKEEFKKKDF